MVQTARSDLATRILDVLMQLVDQAGGGPQPGSQAGDEFAHPFPPSKPLGPPLGGEEYHSQSLIYPGED
jgi:hypothetical protein